MNSMNTNEEEAFWAQQRYSLFGSHFVISLLTVTVHAGASFSATWITPSSGGKRLLTTRFVVR